MYLMTLSLTKKKSIWWPFLFCASFPVYLTHHTPQTPHTSVTVQKMTRQSTRQSTAGGHQYIYIHTKGIIINVWSRRKTTNINNNSLETNRVQLCVSTSKFFVASKFNSCTIDTQNSRNDKSQVPATQHKEKLPKEY